MPTAGEIMSRVLPKPCGNFPLGFFFPRPPALPSALLPACSRSRAFGRSISSSRLPRETASDGRKSFRQVFSSR